MLIKLLVNSKYVLFKLSKPALVFCNGAFNSALACFTSLTIALAPSRSTFPAIANASCNCFLFTFLGSNVNNVANLSCASFWASGVIAEPIPFIIPSAYWPLNFSITPPPNHSGSRSAIFFVNQPIFSIAAVRAGPTVSNVSAKLPMAFALAFILETLSSSPYFLLTAVAVLITSVNSSDFAFSASISLPAVPNTEEISSHTPSARPIYPINLLRTEASLLNPAAAIFAAPPINVNAPENKPSFSVLISETSFFEAALKPSTAAVSPVSAIICFPADLLRACSALYCAAPAAVNILGSLPALASSLASAEKYSVLACFASRTATANSL